MSCIPSACTGIRRIWLAKGIIVVVAALFLIDTFCAPAEAQVSTDFSTAAVSQQVVTQAVSSKAIAKTAKKNALTIISKAKATKGTVQKKLKKIYSYIAKDKSMHGVYQSESFLYFYGKYGNSFYPAKQELIKKSLMQKNYCKYAADMFKEKKGSCYNYAALFAIAAKQMLGKTAVVKIAIGSSKHTGTLNPFHAWTEITLGKKTYIYDTQAGNYISKAKKTATNFGNYAGTLKNKLKKNYASYKDAKYAIVTL